MLIYLAFSVIIAAVLTGIGYIDVYDGSRPLNKFHVFLTAALHFMFWIIAWPVLIGIVILDAIKA